MSHLFTPLTMRSLTVRNRAWVSPMCQYSATDGLVNDWHLVHLGALATGRPGLIMAEATAVSPEGRITPNCAGLWSDDQATAWRRVVDFVHGQGVPIGLQLAHAGRKASVRPPSQGGSSLTPREGGWPTIAPSPVAYGAFTRPQELDSAGIVRLVEQYVSAARRAMSAGFDVLELHMAHGYLLHEFLSPLSNHRTDDYGGSLANRMRLPLEIAQAVRASVGDDLPLFARLSTTDWMAGGWTPEDAIVLARELYAVGVDLIDASSAGLHPEQAVPKTIDYQVDIAARVRAQTGGLVAAVGLITEPEQAERILVDGRADACFLARAMLRDPHWPLRAAAHLSSETDWPVQYALARTWPGIPPEAAAR